MLSRDLQDAVINWSVKHSGHDSHRAYIGLSGIGDCDQVIYDRYFNGVGHSLVGEHLKTRISYEMEAKLVERLGNLGIYGPGEEISLFGGIVQGHTDGVVGQDVLEIKTVGQERHLPSDLRVSHRIFNQVQAYMHFLKRDWCHVLFLARDSGLVEVIGLRYKPEVGKEIEAKVNRLVQAVAKRERPECMCGRCEPVRMQA